MSHLDPTPPDRLSRYTRMRHVANWANLSTALGFGVATAGGAKIRRGPQLLYLAERYRWRFPNGGAFTVGDVVISRHDIGKLTARNPTLLKHEERHSRQWMACLGLPFIPLYLLSMGWSWLRTGDRAARCFFERNAGLADGGYPDVPPRPVGPVLARSVTALVRRFRRASATGPTA